MTNQPLRVLFTIPNFITAGSGRVLANIALGLNRDKFEPTVCVSRKGGSIEAELEAHGIKVLEVPFTVPIKPYPRLLVRAKATAQRFKPYGFDIWHSFHYADDYSEPIISRLGGAKAWVYTKKSMMWGTRAWVLRSLLATKIVADNHDMPGMFFNRFGLKRKVHVIPHGVDTAHFKPRTVDRSAYRVALGVPQDAVLVGLVAHLVPVKGHALLVAAAAHRPGVHLVFAGRANDLAYVEQLKAQVNQLGLQGRVHFVGNVAEMPSFIAQMDIIALPTLSRGEGCPVALLEAMACAKACIATDVPGSRDLIEDGVSGLLVPPEDPHALAGAIQRLADDPDLRARLGTAARQRVEEHYTIEKEVAAHEQLYFEISAI